jgi:hypothetical protein
MATKTKLKKTLSKSPDAIRMRKARANKIVRIESIETTVTSVTKDIDIVRKKLSAKIIIGKRIGKIDAPMDLFTVIGVAIGVKSGQSTYGEWSGLRGQFEVVRCSDGETLQAPLIILPEAATDSLSPYDKVIDCFPFEFGLLVGIDPATNQAGFEYRAEVMFARASDPLAHMRVAKDAWCFEHNKPEKFNAG